MNRRRNLALVAAAALGLLAGGLGVSFSAFSYTTTNPSNTFSAASSFCTSPGTQTYTANADSWVDENKPTQNNGGTSPLSVKSSTSSKRARALVNFSFTAPHDCDVTSATLTLYTSAGSTGRTIAVYRAAASWTEAGVTWNNQPATTGSSATAASVASGNVSWSVTSQVQAGVGNGFIVEDANETSGNVSQSYNSREAASNKPQLSVTYG